MKGRKNPTAVFIAMALVAIILIVGTVLWMRRDSGDEPDVPEPPPSSSEDPTEPDTSLPDIDSTQRDPERPFDPVDWGNMSETLLSEEEIRDSVEDTLEGLLRLDKSVIENISQRSTGGEHNPLRVMLRAVIADEEMKAAFMNMASVSSFEIIHMEKSSTNAYTVSALCTTPYMTDIITRLAAGEQVSFLQEFTTFKASGAAAAVAEMDMSTVPLNSDVVMFAVVVEDDVPVLYHPNSLFYGNNRPQYAFLWGGVDFQGVKNGDLLIANNLGAAQELTREEFSASKSGVAIDEYFGSAFKLIKAGDIEGLRELSLFGVSQGDRWTLSDTYSTYESLYKDFDFLEADTMKRLKSFSYEVKYYSNADETIGIELNTIGVTYSVIDPFTDKRVYFTDYYVFEESSSGKLGESDSLNVCYFVDTILENALGGDGTELRERMHIAGHSVYE